MPPKVMDEFHRYGRPHTWRLAEAKEISVHVIGPDDVFEPTPLDFEFVAKKMPIVPKAALIAILGGPRHYRRWRRRREKERRRKLKEGVGK